MTAKRTTDEKDAILSAIERTKEEFRRYTEDGREPPLGRWLDTFEQLALLGFEYGKREGLKEWERAQERQRKQDNSQPISKSSSNSPLDE